MLVLQALRVWPSCEAHRHTFHTIPTNLTTGVTISYEGRAQQGDSQYVGGTEARGTKDRGTKAGGTKAWGRYVSFILCLR